MKLWEVGNILMDLAEKHGPLNVYFKTKDGELHKVKGVGAMLIPGIQTPVEVLNYGDDSTLNEVLLSLMFFKKYDYSEDTEVRYMRDHPIDFIDYEKDGDFEGIVMRSNMDNYC